MAAIRRRCRELLLPLSGNPAVPGHPTDLSGSRPPAPRPVLTAVAPVPTVLPITAADSGGSGHQPRSLGSTRPGTERGGPSDRGGSSVDDKPIPPDSCHSAVHI